MTAESYNDESNLHEEAPDWLRSQPPALPADEYRSKVHSLNQPGVRNPYRSPEWPLNKLLDEQEYQQFRLYESQLRQDALTGAETVTFEDGETLPLDYDFSLYYANHHLEMITREINAQRNILKDSGKRPDLRLNQRKYIDFVAVKDRVRIEHAIDRMNINWQLKQRGKRLLTNCFLPGHKQDETPSFTVYPDQQSFYCFGCGRGGDVIELARHWFDQTNASIAAEWLCGLVGIEVPRQASKPPSGKPQIMTPNGPVEIDEKHRYSKQRRRGSW